MPGSREARLAAVRGQVAALEAGTRTPARVLPFGIERIDGCLPGGGLPLGRWHELAGEGLEIETAAAPAAFAALLVRPLAAAGAVVWILRRDDLHAPGLAGLGFPAGGLIQVRARDDAEALAAMEDALATAGVAAVVAEADAVDLVAGRRLQLACERRGGAGFLIRRRPFGSPARGGCSASGSAAASRWSVAPAPSAPEPGLPGLGPSRWAVTLQRCRGGRPGAWILEVDESHGPHPFRLVADLADRGLAAEARRRA